MNVSAQRRKFPGRFSKMEIALIIAIVGAVGAILAPVVAQARERERGEACLSHIRELTRAVQEYMTDNDNRLFVYNAVGAPGAPPLSRTGAPRLSQTASGATEWWNVLSPFLKENRYDTILTCPSDDAPAAGDKSAARSYLASRFVEGLRRSQFEDEAETIVIGERWDRNSRGPVRDRWIEPFNGDFDIDRKSGQSEKRFYKVGNRHEGRANLGFLDGHAEAMGPEDIQGSKDLTGCNLIHDYPVPGIMDVTVRSAAGPEEPNICSKFRYSGRKGDDD